MLKKNSIPQEHEEIKKVVQKTLANQFFDIANNIVVVLDTKGTIALANKKGCTFFGYQPKEIIGKRLSNFIAKEYVKPTEQRVSKIITGQEKSQGRYEVEVVAKTGERKKIRWYSHLLKDDNRKPIALISFGEDVTDYNKIIENKSISEEKYRKLFDNSNDAIFVGDTKTGKLIDANKQAEKLIGRKKSEIIGMTPLELHPAEERNIHIKNIKIAMSKKGNHYFPNLHVLHKDGRQIAVDINTTIVCFGDKMVAQAIMHDLTKQKQIEDKLKQSENLYHSLMDTLPFGVDIVDQEGKILFINQFLEKKFGKNIIGKQCWGVYGDDQKKCSACPLGKITKKNQTCVMDSEARMGGRIMQITHKGIIYNNKFAILEIFHDVTEEKTAQELLLKSGRDYKDITSLVPVGIYKTNKKGECLFVNKRWQDIAGLSAKEAMGTGWVQGIHPDDRKKVSKEWNSAVKEGREFYLEYRFMTPKGVITWVVGRAHSLLDDAGNIVGYLGTISDINKLKKIEQELFSNEQRFKAVIDQLPDSFFLLDLEDTKIPLKIIDLNNSACKIHEYKREELLGKSIKELDDKKTSEKAIDIYDVLKQGKEILFEGNHLSKKGKVFPVEISAKGIMLQGKKVAIAIDRDISKQKEEKEQMKEHLSEIEKLNDILVQREITMIELKQKIVELEKLVKS